MKHWLRVLLTPSCWSRVGKLDKEWDKELNSMLDDSPVFSYEDHRLDIEYTVVLNGKANLWVGNYPYSYGGIVYTKNNDGIFCSGLGRGLPSRRTVFRLYDIVQHHIQNGMIQ